MKKLLVVVIIVVIVALLAAYKCSRSRGAEDVETLPETSQPAPAAEPAPAPAAEPAPAPAPAPAAEEQKPVETLPETSQTEQKERKSQYRKGRLLLWTELRRKQISTPQGLQKL